MQPSNETKEAKASDFEPKVLEYYGSTKTYGHNLGFSCAFRQWRAESHCRFIHGYALKFHLEFGSTKVDVRNWVVDFGSLKTVKAWLESMFDHTTLVAADDPKLVLFREMDIAGLIQLRVIQATGCEAMAKMVWEYVDQWLQDNNYSNVMLDKVSVHEHDGNSASYSRLRA